MLDKAEAGEGMEEETEGLGATSAVSPDILPEIVGANKAETKARGATRETKGHVMDTMVTEGAEEDINIANQKETLTNNNELFTFHQLTENSTPCPRLELKVRDKTVAFLVDTGAQISTLG